ncbi:extracellular solute-binding protein [Paenibacillus sp. S150]|uniref:extracellular solute-binding protein n=1 Tax=Paenibacillus sp. S150 TaxID=2749826 RepID=UPI001C569510|nr:extracellular solute-binding protein [Paenibacillus sp. S150]MBW4079909.1 extracellular solute-binding protein [Paenibacillus sp. S150]
MKRKQPIYFILVLLAAMSLAGCSQKGSPQEAAASDEAAANNPAPVELSVWGRWEEATDQINETIGEFQRQYPNITVNYTNVPQYVTQIQAAISGEALPDIFGYHPNLPTSFLSNLGLIHEINDVLTVEEKAEYYEGTWSEGYTLIDGDTYGFPLFNPMRPSMMMYYNKTALQAAGLTESDIPKTWDELYAFSQKVRDNTNGKIYGLVVGVKEMSFLSSIITQMATAVTPEVSPNDSFNYRTGQYEYHSPGIVQGLEFFKSLQDAKLLHPNSLVMSYREGTTLMEEGQAVLTMDGSFLASQLNPANLENYGVAPLPTKDGAPQYAAFQGESRVSLFVSKSTKHYEEAKLFLSFLKDHLYSKLVRDGIEYSPVPSINEATKVNHPVAEQALKIQEDTFLLIPRPFEKNPDSLKVVVETSGKMPKTTLSDIAEGYLTGQIKDLNQQLTELSEESNKVFAEAIDKVNADKGNISQSDYAFPEWTPFTPYK